MSLSLCYFPTMNFSPTKPGRFVYLIFEIPCHFIFIPETLYTPLINPPREKPYLSHSPSVENVETKNAASLHGVEEELGMAKKERESNSGTWDGRTRGVCVTHRI